VQDQPLAGGQLTDPRSLQVTHRKRPAIRGSDRRALRDEHLGQATGVRRFHQHRPLGAALDELLGRAVGDHLAATDHDQVLGGDRHLIHQVAGHEHRAALGGQLLHQVPDPQDAFRVESVHRLVQHQHLRVAQHCRGDAEPLPHSQREPACPLACHGMQTDQVDHLVNPPSGQLLRLREHEQVVVRGATGMHRLGLQQGPDRTQGFGQLPVGPASDRCRACVRAVQAENEPHRRRLAGTVRPEKTRHLTRLYGERQMVHRELVAVMLTEIACFDHRDSPPPTETSEASANQNTPDRAARRQESQHRHRSVACDDVGATGSLRPAVHSLVESRKSPEHEVEHLRASGAVE
jgi:hypothetical protein